MPPLTRRASATVVGWPTFLRAFDWRQGEHVTLVGPTGRGKSHVARQLLGRRAWSVVAGTKPRDATLDGFRADGWRVVRDWPPPALRQRVLLWPRLRVPGDVLNQRAVLATMLDDVFATGAWCVYVDELDYVSRTLRLADRLELLWLQGRALGVSLVVATQRPAHVPLVAYSQATHLFLWRTTDERDLGRLGEIAGGFDKHELRRIVAELPDYAFAYVHAPTGRVTVSRAPAP